MVLSITALAISLKGFTIGLGTFGRIVASEER